MKKTLIVLGILCITNVPISCNNDIDCGGGPPLAASITELSSKIGTFTSSRFSSSPGTNFSQAAIQVYISGMEYAELAFPSRPKPFFIHSAFACSPPEPEPTQAIESILIASESSVFFDGAEYPAGQNLADLFKVTSYFFSEDETSHSIAEFIDRQQTDLWLFGVIDKGAVFQLVDQPDSTINQSFTFEIDFSDGQMLRVQTPTWSVDN